MITAEREAELAKQYGLDKIPTPRYDDIPKVEKKSSSRGVILFHKTLSLIDPIRTAAFHPYLDGRCTIDQTIDTRSWSPEKCFSTWVPTDVPPPVNERITRATGIRATKDDRDYFIWLRDKVYEMWTVVGATRMGPPLIYCGGDHTWRFSRKMRAAGAHMFMGVICKFERDPAKLGANYGVIVPHDQAIKDDHRMLVVPEETNG